MKRWIWKYRKINLGLILLLAIAYFLCLPQQLFEEQYSTVLESANGELLSASIAPDGQWRFPESDSISEKFAEALIAFEDKRFRSHPGFDVPALGRAFIQNLKSRSVVSGGSTITMQVIRMSRKNSSRTILEKAVEIILATRLELRHTKQEILQLYASHAPFGGNVVGLEAACWRYFGHDYQSLSWGEAALLAVLPNAPGLIHPGKNRIRLKIKRDRLLDKLKATGKLDAFTCTLAKEEPIPQAPQPLPRLARHLLNRATNEGYAQQKIKSTINLQQQLRIEQIVNDHHQRLKANQVFNAAVLVLEVSSGKTIAYAGNTTVNDLGYHGHEVDVVTAHRSTGSILKPILYAAMLDEGKILPKTILPDIPTLINGFAPENFSREYDGAVAADKALIRSLNVPAVYMLRDYRYEKFHHLLKNIGMGTLNKPPDHYGLSLILGGAEGTLWDITGIYASMARTLNNYFKHPGQNRYRKKDFHAPVYILRKNETADKLERTSWLSAGSIFLTFHALKEVYRPGEETGWKYFDSSKPIAWKTGTSFGLRDGWAVGVTPDYAVGVWVGNADGEGRPGLTGTESAAPILFDVFSQLRGNTWFQKPLPELYSVVTCRKSGFRVSSYCEERDTIYSSLPGLSTAACPYHQKIHVSADNRFRIHSECAPLNTVKHVSWFVLPPVQEYYFKTHNLAYKPLPPYRNDCESTTGVPAMDMIYPEHNSKIFIPRHIDGKPGYSVFELAHRITGVQVYWHLNGVYIGSTKKSHQLTINPGEGKHVLMVIDEHGELLERHFEVISRM